MQARTSSGSDSEVIEMLTNELTSLKAELINLKRASSTSEAPNKNFYSPEQVDEEIRKAVSSAIADVSKGDKDMAIRISEYKSNLSEMRAANDNINRLYSAVLKENSQLKEKLSKLEADVGELVELRQQVSVLKQDLIGKQEVIDVLKAKPAVIDSYNNTSVEDSQRPQMEQVFVDPLDDTSGDGLKPSISVETILKEDTVDDKVDKLRDLLGKSLR
jgi:chromosome segregation ATPase